MDVVRFTRKVLAAAREHKVFWSLENPFSSGLFEFPPIAAEVPPCRRPLAANLCQRRPLAVRAFRSSRSATSAVPGVRPSRSRVSSVPTLRPCRLWARGARNRPRSQAVYGNNVVTEVRFRHCSSCCRWSPALPLHARLWSGPGEDLGPHEHEHLEGTVAVQEQGLLVRKWKTSLAGRYAPSLCRAWALILREHAPPGALRSPSCPRPGLETCWQLWLMQAAGECGYAFLPTPSCPVEFSSGWEGAVSVWCHSQGRAPRSEATLASGGAAGAGPAPGDSSGSAPAAGGAAASAPAPGGVAGSAKMTSAGVKSKAKRTANTKRKASAKASPRTCKRPAAHRGRA